MRVAGVQVLGKEAEGLKVCYEKPPKTLGLQPLPMGTPAGSEMTFSAALVTRA